MHSCNLPCQHPCHMDSIHRLICISPISCSNNGQVSHSLLAHMHMVFCSQILLCPQDLSKGHAFWSGFSIAIAFLAMMGRHSSHLHTNLTSKVIEPLISWLEIGCQLKTFQIGFTLGGVLQTWLFNTPKKIGIGKRGEVCNGSWPERSWSCTQNLGFRMIYKWYRQLSAENSFLVPFWH
jgi:hypothetical protein